MVQKNLVYVYKTIFLKFINSFKKKAEDRLNSFFFVYSFRVTQNMLYSTFCIVYKNYVLLLTCCSKEVKNPECLLLFNDTD